VDSAGASAGVFAAGRAPQRASRGRVQAWWWDEAVTEGADEGEQLALLAAARSSARAARSKAAKPPREPAADLPVARVAVDVGLAHLDRPFDFLVPAELHEVAQPGVRVRVRFAGRLVDGFLLERVATSEHEGRLATLERVVSPEPVLTPQVLRLAREVADRYAGTLADVLRLAVPPRHARVETAQPADDGTAGEVAAPDPAGWSRYDHGPALLDALRSGATVRAVWSALPGPTWPDEVARLVASALSAGRGALVVLPDHRDVDRVDRALTGLLGSDDHHVVLTAEPGPAERYRRWLRVRRGEVRAVVGTRAAMFAPVRDLGLAVVWDDGDDLHAEPRAPYPHVRTVLAHRSSLEGAALVVGGLSRTAEGAALVRSGWARSVTAPRTVVRRTAPAVVADPGADDARDPDGRAARLPRHAWRTARDGLTTGPVLVQVPRAGYLPGLACADCRRPARCPACRGPLAAGEAERSPACRWCGTVAARWVCPSCDGRRLRATVIGVRRTAEELGRAFPRVPVRTSGGTAPVLARVDAEPALVVATPGAEPVADGGYAAALLLDGWALLGRPDLRAAEEALRRWTAAAALVRPGADGGTVVVMAEAGLPAVQALVRFDHAGFAERELAERATLRLPPEAWTASLTGEPAALRDLLDSARLPPYADLLGPVPAGPEHPQQQRFLVRVPRADGAAAARALKEALGVRSAHKEAGPVRVQVDPLEFG
jgi:primosomal protein N' (replication factor Y)